MIIVVVSVKGITKFSCRRSLSGCGSGKVEDAMSCRKENDEKEKAQR